MIPVKGLQNTRPLDSKPIRILAKLPRRIRRQLWRRSWDAVKGR